MFTLAINTASSSTAIALFSEGKLIAENSWKSHNDEAEQLMPFIDALLTENKKTFSDITAVICVRGPGSFTGLRVGVTVANTIAYLTGADLLEIDTFQYHWTVASSESSATTALLIFAGARGLYISFAQEEEPHLIPLDEAEAFLKEYKITTIFGDITEDQKNELASFPYKDTTQTFGEIIELALKNNPKKVKIIHPRYVKPPGITQSKNKLF